MPSFNGWTKTFSLSVGACLFLLCFCFSASAQAPPTYKVDAMWPKQLPNNWIMGQVGGMAVDGQDHIWVMQRPSSNTKDDLGAAQTPPLPNAAFPRRPFSCLMPRAIFSSPGAGRGRATTGRVRSTAFSSTVPATSG